jgi:hypothetical protein
VGFETILIFVNCGYINPKDDLITAQHWFRVKYVAREEVLECALLREGHTRMGA